MKLRSLSLKYKFIIIIVIFTVLLTVSFGFIVTNRLSEELWKQFYSDGEDLVKSIASQANSIGQQEDAFREVLERIKVAGEALDFVQGYFFQEEIMYSQLVYDGASLTHTNPGEVPQGIFLVEPIRQPNVPMEIRLPDNKTVFDFQQELACGSSLEVAEEDISLCSNGPSYAKVGLSPIRVQQELRQAVLLIVFISAAFILIGILVAFILYKWVLGPVDVLTASVKQFRRERFVRANVHSGDELETLAVEFNKMASTIERHEGHMERINEELFRANQVKSEFLAVMGHELKTPLHAIRGFSQLLLEEVDGALSQGQRQDTEAILSSGNHLLELIDNVLRFSKLESGEEPLHIEQIRADHLSENALRTVESLVRKSDLLLINNAQPLTVEADETKLKQILINLISNAIKYAPEGTITISAERVENKVRFGVADTGPGIAPENADKVFEPFTQLDGSTTRESSGIGLGLAIVKKYIEMHGGQVWHEPNPGGGTIFYFYLPMVQSEFQEFEHDTTEQTNGSTRAAVSVLEEEQPS